MSFNFRSSAVIAASMLGFALEYAAFFHVSTQSGPSPLGGTVIDDKTLVSLGTALAILSPIGIGVFWLTKTLDGMKKELKELQRAGKETWSYNQMRVWALEFEKANRDLKVEVPRPERPIKTPKDNDDDDK